MTKSKFEYILQQVYFFFIGFGDVLLKCGVGVFVGAFLFLQVVMIGHFAYEPIFTFAPYDITEIQMPSEIRLFGEHEPNICNRASDNIKCFELAFGRGFVTIAVVSIITFLAWVFLKLLHSHGKGLYEGCKQ